MITSGASAVGFVLTKPVKGVNKLAQISIHDKIQREEHFGLLSGLRYSKKIISCVNKTELFFRKRFHVIVKQIYLFF